MWVFIFYSFLSHVEDLRGWIWSYWIRHNLGFVFKKIKIKKKHENPIENVEISFYKAHMQFGMLERTWYWTSFLAKEFTSVWGEKKNQFLTQKEKIIKNMKKKTNNYGKKLFS